VHALNTERFLDGKNLFDTTTLQTALNILDAELRPDQVLPDASPTYRKRLASAVFYKVVQMFIKKQNLVFNVNLF
jgi:xanthine dehydrogenase/oxidase